MQDHSPDLAALERFFDFARKKTEMGGPDVHMRAFGSGIGSDDHEERLWRTCMYATFSSTAPAAAVWARWPRDKVLSDPDGAIAWVLENFLGLPIRDTRRPVRSKKQLARCIVSAASWARDRARDMETMSYDEAWECAHEIHTFGRYVRIRFLEALARYCGYDQLILEDIRPKGGWGPRKGLALIYPCCAEKLASKDDRPLTLDAANAHALDLKLRTEAELGRSVSWHVIETLICNYRQALGGRMYPGRTLDNELEYHRRVEDWFGHDPYLGTFDFFKARAVGFDERCLAEVRGWAGTRKELLVAAKTGAVWTDLQYDWFATTEPSDPATWKEYT